VAVLDSSAPVEQVMTHPPIAVFEVLSPEDTVQRLKHKLEDYSAMGIGWSILRMGAFRAMKIGNC
jgi:hypothetical protein